MELLFVYNADSSLASQLKDYVHKAVAPSSYECNLCQITYGGLGMKSEWKDFIKTLPYKITFLHRDEFQKEYPNIKDVKLPVVLKKEGEQITEFITAAEINSQKTIEDLKNLVKEKLL